MSRPNDAPRARRQLVSRRLVPPSPGRDRGRRAPTCDLAQGPGAQAAAAGRDRAVSAHASREGPDSRTSRAGGGGDGSERVPESEMSERRVGPGQSRQSEWALLEGGERGRCWSVRKLQGATEGRKVTDVRIGLGLEEGERGGRSASKLEGGQGGREGNGQVTAAGGAGRVAAETDDDEAWAEPGETEGLFSKEAQRKRAHGRRTTLR